MLPALHHTARTAGPAQMAAGLLLSGALSSLGQTHEMYVPSQPLIAVASSAGWTVGLHYAGDARELKAGGEVLDLDANRVAAEIGYQVAPFLHLAAQAGWTQADLDGQEGENGLVWAASARANLAEHVLRASPEVGRKEWVGAALEAQYRYNESNQDQADLDWSETRVVPSVYYFRNLRGDAMRKDYNPSGYGVHGGLAFSSIDGSFGGADVEENRNFGFVLGADARWASDWVAHARAYVFGSGDQSIEIGTTFHF